MSVQPPTPFERMMQQIQGLPLWIKQVVYIQMKSDLEKILTKSTVEAFGENEMLQLMVPQINHYGRQELERPSGQVSMEILKVLYWAAQGKNVMNICVINQWTLEQVCAFLFTCIEKGFVLPPASVLTQATLLYLGSKIRLGDYLVKIGRLKIDQLDQALRTQRYIEESLGERTGIGNIFINLGYIHKQDCEGILFLKEECKKPFPINLFLEPESGEAPQPGMIEHLKKELSASKEEARAFQEKVRQLESQLELIKNTPPPKKGFFG
ncbi:MAG: hypothetical protein K2X66_15675 [Cyanobacteria bacterium]|nr:hypothetical protein [Cyanobacteriota bacterium]